MSLGRNGARQGGSALPSYYGANTVTTRDSQAVARSKARAGPNRTTKASGKLKILPEEPEDGGVNPSGRPTSHRQAGAASQAHERFADGLDLHSAREVSIVDDDDDESSEDDDDDGEGEEHRAKLSKQLELARIPEGSMRRDARRITRKGRATLPRVTAYSTATSYRMRELTKWLQGRRDTHRTNAMTFDECVYSTYSYDLVDQNRGLQHDFYSHTHQTPANGVRSAPIEARLKASSVADQRTGREAKTADLLGIPELHRNDDTASSAEAETAVGLKSTTTLVDVNVNDTEGNSGYVHARYDDGHDDAQREGDASAFDDAEKQRQQDVDLVRREEAKRRRRERFAVHGMVPEVFLMEYGTVVIWGMTVAEEKRLLRELRRFEVEKLAPEDVESEDLNWYLADYSRIYNDVITLRKGSSYMTKLSLSHALAQSTKISFFEGVIDNTIDTTKDIPQSIAESGKIGLPPVDIMKQIGHLFILRMNIHLVGSIVDSPEIFWAQPDLEPLYSAARSYLEIPQRIELLNARVEVLQDMLQLLKDQVTSSHSEWLEIIVIVLILLEIILGVATMVVDLYFA